MRIMTIFAILILVTASTAQTLDLREANVTDVEFQELEGKVNFDVTLYHNDDGEEGYADYWQVESLNGTLLGRRILTHAHGTVEFTRSAVIPISIEEWVVVRGHDATHGFGGQLALVNMDTAEKIFVDQGSEPQNMSDYFENSTFSVVSTNRGSTSQSVPLATPLLLVAAVLVARKIRR